jgi:dUTP diphosphatase
MLDFSKPKCEVSGEYIPVYSHAGDAGADLRSSVDEVIPARGKNLVATGIRLKLPADHVGLIWPRSGLAVKHALDCGAGVIDSGYRGEVKVLLFNHSDEDYCIKKGDRIAQLIVQKFEKVDFVPVESLEETTRGAQGFGSTGK